MSPQEMFGLATESRGYGIRGRIKSLVIAVIIAAGGFLVWYTFRREYWHNTARQVWGRRIPVTFLLILLVYIVIGLLDSVGWRDPILDIDGKLVRNDKAKLVYTPQSLSLHD